MYHCRNCKNKNIKTQNKTAHMYITAELYLSTLEEAVCNFSASMTR